MLIVLIHVTVAIASLITTTLSAIVPSSFKLKLSYCLISLTFASGTLLVVVMHQPVLKSCMAGLAYLAAALVGVVVGRRRLASEKINL
jgi:hypothetical protein